MPPTYPDICSVCGVVVSGGAKRTVKVYKSSVSHPGPFALVSELEVTGYICGKCKQAGHRLADHLQVGLTADSPVRFIIQVGGARAAAGWRVALQTYAASFRAALVKEQNNSQKFAEDAARDPRHEFFREKLVITDGPTWKPPFQTAPAGCALAIAFLGAISALFLVCVFLPNWSLIVEAKHKEEESSQAGRSIVISCPPRTIRRAFACQSHIPAGSFDWRSLMSLMPGWLI